jgi:ubiquinone/menaquinone biosynthesis C-methylase UbiE
MKNKWHVYPRTSPNAQPGPWWYYGRALYVSRRDYFKIYWLLMIFLGIPFATLALRLDYDFWKIAALQGGTVSLIYLGYSIFGLYRMYGHPSRNYMQKLVDDSKVDDPRVVVDVHIGTYRHSYALAELLPNAIIHSVDCWDDTNKATEVAIRDVRDLECMPTHHPRILPSRASASRLPFADASCDVVVFGFGTHEIPNDGARQKLFAEAKRILKPGGKALMFEHGNDFHNILLFGPVIGHVATCDEWMNMFKKHFGDIGYARTSHAVDLFWGSNAEPVGTVCSAPPKAKGRLDYKPWTVIAIVSIISMLIVEFLPREYLISIYLVIAFLGIAWPWMAIAFALLCDRFVRRQPRPLTLRFPQSITKPGTEM